MEGYGAPLKLCSDVHRIYLDLIVVLNIEKSLEEMIQQYGVRQGYKMSPVLFLFLKDIFSEIFG